MQVKQALPASLCIDNQQMQHLLKELVRLNPTLSLSGGNQPPSKGVQFFATSPDVNLNTVSEQDLAAAKVSCVSCAKVYDQTAGSGASAPAAGTHGQSVQGERSDARQSRLSI